MQPGSVKRHSNHTSEALERLAIIGMSVELCVGCIITYKGFDNPATKLWEHVLIWFISIYLFLIHLFWIVADRYTPLLMYRYKTAKVIAWIMVQWIPLSILAICGVSTNNWEFGIQLLTMCLIQFLYMIFNGASPAGECCGKSEVDALFTDEGDKDFVKECRRKQIYALDEIAKKDIKCLMREFHLTPQEAERKLDEIAELQIITIRAPQIIPSRTSTAESVTAELGKVEDKENVIDGMIGMKVL